MTAIAGKDHQRLFIHVLAFSVLTYCRSYPSKTSPRVPDRCNVAPVPDYPPNNRVSAKESMRNINTGAGEIITHQTPAVSKQAELNPFESVHTRPLSEEHLN